MKQEIFTQGDKVLFLRYYECKVLEIMGDASEVFYLYLIETLDTGRRFIAYPNDLQLLE